MFCGTLPTFKNSAAFLDRSPLQNSNGNVAHAPFIHRFPFRLVNIDGLRTDQGTPVVIHNVLVWQSLDHEACADWILRPICRSAPNSRTVLKSIPCGCLSTILQVVRLGMRVGRRPHHHDLIGGAILDRSERDGRKRSGCGCTSRRWLRQGYGIRLHYDGSLSAPRKSHRIDRLRGC